MSKKIKNFKADLQKKIKAKNIKENELLKNHTSFKIGGPCLLLIEPTSKNELVYILQLLKKYKLKHYIIGNGTNLLISDKGLKAVVIKLSDNFSYIKRKKQVVTASAGASLKKLNDYCIQNELSGLEFSYGIPGTIGGAVYMNAGAYKGQIADVVKSVTFFDGKKIKTLKKDKLKFSYRRSLFQKKHKFVILSVQLQLNKSTKAEVEILSNNIINKRKEKHPTGYASAGSVFKRNKSLIASKAIDASGLKGYSVGDAQVSTKHAGFIINKNNATKADVLKLIKHVQKSVYKKYKVKLKLEIKLLGD
jgi:UDP-N-acetylmuramate dehydrogenase